MYQTEHNKELLNFFEAYQNQSFSPKSICELFKYKMDRSTIYRRLATLEEAHKIRKIYLPDADSYEYQYIGQNCSTHLHLVCSNCGKTIHLECEKSMDFLNHLLKEHHFNVNQSQSVIFGLCEECNHA